jgi:hypothetical protein
MVSLWQFLNGRGGPSPALFGAGSGKQRQNRWEALAAATACFTLLHAARHSWRAGYADVGGAASVLLHGALGGARRLRKILRIVLECLKVLIGSRGR